MSRVTKTWAIFNNNPMLLETEAAVVATVAFSHARSINFLLDSSLVLSFLDVYILSLHLMLPIRFSTINRYLEQAPYINLNIKYLKSIKKNEALWHKWNDNYDKDRVNKVSLMPRVRKLETETIPKEIAVKCVGRKWFILGHHVSCTANSWEGQSCVGSWFMEGLCVTTNLSSAVSCIEEPRMARNC